MDWIKLALALPLGQSKKMTCWECGRKDKAYISNNGKECLAYCFVCPMKSRTPYPPMTPQERYALRKAAEAFESSPPTLPEDFTLDMHVQGLLWITKGGIHMNDAKKYGWGWSDKMRRVIMPVYDEDTLVAVQARAVFEGMEPKYLGQIWKGPRPVFKAGDRNSGTLVLTEDMLSAGRVAKVTDAWSLLGTNMLPAVVAKVATAPYDHIKIWMDNDYAGITARKGMLRTLGAVGVNATSIISDRDPKHHTLDEIKTLIGEYK